MMHLYTYVYIIFNNMVYIQIFMQIQLNSFVDKTIQLQSIARVCKKIKMNTVYF